MKKSAIVVLLIALSVAALCACGKEKEPETPVVENDAAIFGTWMEDYWDSGYTFREDGTGTDIFWSQEFTYTALDGKVEIVYTEGLWAEKEFTYTVAGNVLQLTEVLAPDASEEPGTWDYTKEQ